ncbi:MAG TPA: carboxymuconolactone decarboxylase family protein [Caulobacteraceae bacterium]
MRARTALPRPDQLSAAQRAVYDSIFATRGNVEGPFLAWLHSPEMAGHAEKLGAFCRYGTGLGRREVEFLILVTAAHYRCNGEWRIHAPIALEAGVPAEAVEAIRAGRDPEFGDPALGALHAFAGALLRTNRVDDATFEAAAGRFGEAILVEVVGVVGYYGLVAMTLNAFDMDVGEGPPFFD